jgi:hypothetical protein
MLLAAATLSIGLGVGYGLGVSRSEERELVADPPPVAAPLPLAAGSFAPRVLNPFATPSARATAPPRSPERPPPKRPAVPQPDTRQGEVLDPWGPRTGSLSSAQVQSVVARNRSGIERSCWQRAFANRPEGAPETARVSIALRVGASGVVESVSTTGDPPGYSGLASCIADRARGWTFPPAQRSTSVNVPFAFVAVGPTATKSRRGGAARTLRKATIER